MHVVLYGLGLLFTAIGFALAGYGIPINEFSLGNTLIIAGATLTSGGLVLIGLGAVVSRLRAIALALGADEQAKVSAKAKTSAKPATAAKSDAPELPARADSRVTFPTKPVPPPLPDIVPDPRLGPAAPPPDFDEAFEPPRAKAPPRLPEPPAGGPDLAPEAPLSPRELAQRELSARDMPPRERAGFTLSRSNVGASERPFAASAPEPPPEPGPERPADRLKSPASFDSVWPSDRRPSRPAPEPAERPEPPLRAEPSLRAEPGPSARPFEPEPRRAEPPPLAAHSEPPRAVAILKSGVVDGMAYTLYADGSIEAQLPQGTVRFGSIAELREHIEKHS